MDKAAKACRDYAVNNAKIRALSKLIGSKLSDCHAASDQGQPYESHIAMALQTDTDDYGNTHWLDADERKEILDNCEHCTAAWQAIQDRKAARKAFGVAKRAIGVIGRAALKHAEVQP